MGGMYAQPGDSSNPQVKSKYGTYIFALYFKVAFGVD